METNTTVAIMGSESNEIVMSGDSAVISDTSVVLKSWEKDNVGIDHNAVLAIVSFPVLSIMLSIVHPLFLLSVIPTVFLSHWIYTNAKQDAQNMKINIDALELDPIIDADTRMEVLRLLCDMKGTGEVYLGRFHVDELVYTEGLVQLDDSTSNLICDKNECRYCDSTDFDSIVSDYKDYCIGLDEGFAGTISYIHSRYKVSQTLIKDADGPRVHQVITESPLSLWDANMDALEALSSKPVRGKTHG